MKAARRKSHAPSWTAPRSYTSHGCRAEVSRKDAKITAKNAKKSRMNENSVAREIVDAAYRVHTTLGPGLLESVYEAALGPGLLESVYEAALAYELEKRGLNVGRQQAVPAVYEEVHIHTAFYADLIVEDNVIVEIKAVETVAPVHKMQLLTY